MSNSRLFLVFAALTFVVVATCAEQYGDDDMGLDKRSMRNAMVRFGRAGMRNALVRFGKRSDASDVGLEAKRNGAPEPFVRFGRSSGRPAESLHDLMDAWQKLDFAFNEHNNA
ncbi:hypothetical protein M3Y99_00874400 [Aphelenchoides fujianensis]|nr:hypothetical protein M3Y99_00874400 [Aphelenchoides fujianensis]